jgi:DUF4097 and DUF4098 domain-containing protein YvlB
MYSKIKLLKQFSISLLISIALSYTACGSMHMNIDHDLELINEKTFPITPGKILNVDFSSGDVLVTYWDKSEVSVKIYGNENASKKMDFNIDGNDESIEVRGKNKSSGSSWFSNIEVKVEVKVPSKFNLDINTAGGDIKCGGITGSAQLNTSGGDIWADKFSGKLDVSTSGGDVYLFCTDTKIEAETSGGDIKLEYTGENKGIELSTSGGDIEIKLPKDFRASIDLSTSGGEVSCSFNMKNIKKSHETNLVGDINSGGEKLIAHTSGGDIDVYEK